MKMIHITIDIGNVRHRHVIDPEALKQAARPAEFIGHQLLPKINGLQHTLRMAEGEDE